MVCTIRIRTTTQMSLLLSRRWFEFEHGKRGDQFVGLAAILAGGWRGIIRSDEYNGVQTMAFIPNEGIHLLIPTSGLH